MNIAPSCRIQKYAVFKSNKAFTLIEVLFSLTIFSIIVFFIGPVFHITMEHKESRADLQAMEWAVFCSQFKKEVRNSTKAEVLSGTLHLTKETETVQYEKYQNSLRRRVNSSGHEILLQNVSESSISILKNAIKITVKDLSGREYSVIAYSLIDWSKPA